MKSKLVITGIVLVSLSLNLVGWAQESELLDLTQKKNKDQSSTGGTGGGAGGGLSHGNRRSVLPVKLTLSKLDKRQYKLGEHFIYEITLENLGDHPLWVPWEAEKENLKSDSGIDPIERVEGSFYLILDELQGGVIVGAEEVYASRSVPTSLKKLLPRQKISFRAGGIWYFLSEDARRNIIPTLPQTLNIRAEFILKEPLKAYEPLRSDILQVELER